MFGFLPLTAPHFTVDDSRGQEFLIEFLTMSGNDLTVADGKNDIVVRKSFPASRSPLMIKDRIKELRRVPAKLLVPHPKNWRTHHARQQDVLQGILSEVGYADALLARELPDGSLQLIDGHLRAKTTPDQLVPVLIVDLNDQEAEKLLAVLDPIAALAGTDTDLLAEIVSRIETENEAVQQFVDELNPCILDAEEKEVEKEIEIAQVFQIVVTCQDEEEQREVFESLNEQGRVCRIVNL
jgi:hypothetical protein